MLLVALIGRSITDMGMDGVGIDSSVTGRVAVQTTAFPELFQGVPEARGLLPVSTAAAANPPRPVAQGTLPMSPHSTFHPPHELGHRLESLSEPQPPASLPAQLALFH